MSIFLPPSFRFFLLFSFVFSIECRKVSPLSFCLSLSLSSSVYFYNQLVVYLTIINIIILLSSFEPAWFPSVVTVSSPFFFCVFLSFPCPCFLVLLHNRLVVSLRSPPHYHLHQPHRREESESSPSAEAVEDPLRVCYSVDVDSCIDKSHIL